jgi:hypothetical protein
VIPFCIGLKQVVAASCKLLQTIKTGNVAKQSFCYQIGFGIILCPTLTAICLKLATGRRYTKTAAFKIFPNSTLSSFI